MSGCRDLLQTRLLETCHNGADCEHFNFRGAFLRHYLTLALLSGLLFLHPGNILSEEPSQLIGFIENSAEKTILRIAFERISQQWISIYPSTSDIKNVTSCRSESAKGFLKWKALYSGREIGEVATRGYLTPKYYSEIGSAKIVTETPVPRVGERSLEFAGWLDKPVFRPLVAITGRHFKDPEGWSPSKSQISDLKQLWPLFTKNVGIATNCKIDAKGD